jgi:hypothetical protein
MKTTFKLLAFLITVCAAVAAQVVPEATAGRGLPVSGTLHYDLRYSQSADFGSTLGDWQTANASADANYANGKANLPFSLNYGGGYTWTLAGPGYSTGFFQHLTLSQGFVRRKWNVTLTDSVSYLPQSPTTGFSGIPGTGEPIGGSGSTTPPDQTILTVNTHTVDNSANGEFQRTLNSATTLNAGGGSTMLRYTDGNGLDTDSWNLSTGFTRRLTKRNSLTGQYSFSQNSYPGFGEMIKTNTVLATYQRQWTRRLTTNVGAGPEWVSILNSTSAASSTGGDTTTTPSSPNSTRVSGNAGVTYNMRFGSAGVNYSHGTNGGAGYTFGAENDTASANFSREFNKTLTIGFTGSYMRTVGLQANGVTNAKYGGVQASRRIGRYFNAFANYTAMDQSTSAALNPNVHILSGLTQVFGFGIGYSPRETHLRH